MGGCLPEVRSFFEENKIKESRTIDEIQIAWRPVNKVSRMTRFTDRETAGASWERFGMLYLRHVSGAQKTQSEKWG
jgi:hypothetical protein